MSTMLPEVVQRDVERTVAAALDDPNLKGTVERHVGPVPGDQDTVDLVVLLVPYERSDGWPAAWTGGSDTFGPYLNGFVVAAVQAQDIAAGRNPAARLLKPYQQEWLDKYRAQADHEAGGD